MTAGGFLLERFAAAGDKTAFVEADGSRESYAGLLARIGEAGAALDAAGVGPGASVQLRGDFGAAATAFLLALWARGAVVSPVAPVSLEKAAEFADVGQAAWIVDAASGTIEPGPGASAHALYDDLRGRGVPGLVIFSSGTTGVSKGAVHDATRLLSKFETPGKDFRTLAFLLFDHIAGVDTLLYCLSNASTIVCPADRTPEAICRLIAAEAVEVLPTAPSFLNLMLLSGAHERHDLSSLKIVTYGAEMMPQALLERVAAALPKARLVQKYGTSEIGALRSKSEGNASRWIRIGGQGADWRVVEGLLEVKTGTAMLGYLNAPSPFTEDGWYRTGDRVEVRGDMVRFLGRDSDVINVGGQKVFPAEVEAEIARLPGVAEVAVSGAPHPILGAVVTARIRMTDPAATPTAVRTALRQGLSGRLEPYKIPQKIKVTADPLVTERFKQRR
ncbi:ANL family adenylate-forming protein [Halovulum sp. GXIMD14794]